MSAATTSRRCARLLPADPRTLRGRCWETSGRGRRTVRCRGTGTLHCTAVVSGHAPDQTLEGRRGLSPLERLADLAVQPEAQGSHRAKGCRQVEPPLVVERQGRPGRRANGRGLAIAAAAWLLKRPLPHLSLSVCHRNHSDRRIAWGCPAILPERRARERCPGAPPGAAPTHHPGEGSPAERAAFAQSVTEASRGCSEFHRITSWWLWHRQRVAVRCPAASPMSAYVRP